MPSTAAQSEILRCAGCCKPERHQCIGRRDAAGKPRCSCIQCHGAAIRADAEHYTEPIVVELRRYVKAQRLRTAKARTWPQPARRVRCHGYVLGPDRAWHRCTEMVESARFGRPRVYHSARCQRSARWLREKARRASGQIPTG